MSKTGAWILLLITAAAAKAAAAEPVSVSLSSRGGAEAVSGAFTVSAPSAAVWGTLSDYNGLAAFVPSLVSSKVVPDKGGLYVAQVARGRFLFFHRDLSVLLKVSEQPYRRIEFADVSRRDFKSYQGSWTIEPAGTGWRVRYELAADYATALPDFIVRGLFRRDAGGLLEAVRREILRRAASEGAAKVPSAGRPS